MAPGETSLPGDNRSFVTAGSVAPTRPDRDVLGQVRQPSSGGGTPLSAAPVATQARDGGAYNQSSVVWHHRDTAMTWHGLRREHRGRNGRQAVEVQFWIAQVGRAASAGERRDVSCLRALRKREEPRRLHTSGLRRRPRLNPLGLHKTIGLEDARAGVLPHLGRVPRRTYRPRRYTPRRV